MKEEFRFDGDQVKHVKTVTTTNQIEKKKSAVGKDSYNYYQVDNPAQQDQDDDVDIDIVPQDDIDDEEEDEIDEEEEDDDDDDDEILSNDIPAWPPKNRRKIHGLNGGSLRQASVRAFRANKKGYHASTGPADFMKKRYRSEVLEV